ncbi:murein biosynthesis integral membrane protein MurJ [Gephyromycinifex aptenodytis]|uniref:murein biosynthesis integral membrane protein MurJ n=1 Tax=Gephyromycinifex aptenodytis TaxID=2716227 RepID=UPI001446F6D6|nr:murein biosynthesis integral membrane protein MurJ [Gephyromycinifex aptenodytis]
MTATKNRSLARNSAVMAAGSFVSRILGVVRQAMIVMIFGRSVAGDAWSIANTLPNTVFLLLAGGVLNAVLVPQITKAQKQEDGGREFIDKLLTLALIGLGVVTLLAVPAAPWLVRLFSDSAFPPGGRELAVAFAYIALPAIFFYGLYAILGQVLNAREAFGWFSWAPVLCNIVWILGLGSFLYLYGHQLGHPDQFTPPMVWLLAGSLTVGVALQALILLVPLWRSGFRYRPRTGFRGVGLGSASRVAMWTFAALVISQLGLVVQSKVLTSAVEGGNTGKLAYDSAFMLFMTPHGLITVSVVTALFTSMSKAAANQDTDSVRHDVLHGLGIVGATVIPVMAGTLALGTALTATIFVGSSSETTNAIGYVMMAMMIGLPAYGAFYVAQRAFFAYEDAKTPFMLQLLNTGVGAAVALSSYLVAAQFRAIGVAGGQALSNIVAAAVALIWLSRHLGGLSYAVSVRTWVRAFVASLPAALVAALIAWLSRTYLPAVMGGPADGMWFASVVALAVGGTVFIVMYIAAARRMRISELEEFLGPVLRRLRGASGRGAPRA